MDFDLAIVLTAAGATVSAALIASLIQVMKRVPTIGAFIDDKREPGVALILSVALVAYAFLATTPKLDAMNAFAAFLAWLAVAGLATKAHDVTPEAVNNALSGG